MSSRTPSSLRALMASLRKHKRFVTARDLIPSSNMMQVPQDRQTEASVTSPEPSADACIPLVTNSDSRPLASSLSSSISCLTDLSEGEEDIDGLVSGAGVESNAPLLVDHHRHGFLWEAREPALTISDDDVEETSLRLRLATEDNSQLGLAPVTDSIDDLVALFAALRVSRVVSSAPQQVCPTPVLPVPLQLLVDVSASQEVTPPVEPQQPLPSTSRLRICLSPTWCSKSARKRTTWTQKFGSIPPTSLKTRTRSGSTAWRHSSPPSKSSKCQLSLALLRNPLPQGTIPSARSLGPPSSLAGSTTTTRNSASIPPAISKRCASTWLLASFGSARSSSVDSLRISSRTSTT